MQIVKQWVKMITRNKGHNEQLVQEANAKIFTFGSYRLGVWTGTCGTMCIGNVVGKLKAGHVVTMSRSASCLHWVVGCSE